MRYLAAHDPDYLAALRACIDEPDPEERFARFEALAVRTLHPGGAWQQGETNFQFRPGSRVSPAMVQNASRFWDP
jgi:hypothetical protein